MEKELSLSIEEFNSNLQLFIEELNELKVTNVSLVLLNDRKVKLNNLRKYMESNLLSKLSIIKDNYTYLNELKLQQLEEKIVLGE